MKILPASWVSRAAKRKSARVFLASFLLVLLGAGQAPILAGPLVPLATTPPTVLDSPKLAGAPDATPTPTRFPAETLQGERLASNTQVHDTFAQSATGTATTPNPQPNAAANGLPDQSQDDLATLDTKPGEGVTTLAYAPGRILVKFKQGVSNSQGCKALAAAQNVHAKLACKAKFFDTTVVGVSAATEKIPDVARAVATSPATWRSAATSSPDTRY